MRRFRTAVLLAVALLICPSLSASAAGPDAAAKPHLIDRFKALAGEWSAAGLDGNSMPNATVSYTVTAGGNAVEELLFAGTPHEMRTLYVRDGEDVVLVHFCASGNHPKMRSRMDRNGEVVFDFDGAINFDPAKAAHMHDARFAFVGPDELTSRWQFWGDGKPAEHVANFHLKRVKIEPNELVDPPR